MVGDMQTVFLLAHNTRTGMFDYRSYDPVPCERPLQVYQLFQQILDGLVVNKDRAMAEVNADYAMTTEIADALLKKADAPFRVGHHFASLLTNYGRGLGLKLQEIPYAEAVRIYQADATYDFPLSEAEFKEAIDAEHMVYGMKGSGGPQIAEVDRMLADEQGKVVADLDWLKARKDHLAAAEMSLNEAVATLAAGAGLGINR
jgi:argininosuccinate lyase